MVSIAVTISTIVRVTTATPGAVELVNSDRNVCTACAASARAPAQFGTPPWIHCRASLSDRDTNGTLGASIVEIAKLFCLLLDLGTGLLPRPDIS